MQAIYLHQELRNRYSRVLRGPEYTLLLFAITRVGYNTIIVHMGNTHQWPNCLSSESVHHDARESLGKYSIEWEQLYQYYSCQWQRRAVDNDDAVRGFTHQLFHKTEWLWYLNQIRNIRGCKEWFTGPGANPRGCGIYNRRNTTIGNQKIA